MNNSSIKIIHFDFKSGGTDADRIWLKNLWLQEWGGDTMVTRGKSHHLNDLLAMIAWQGNERVGAATYRVERDECELMSLNALYQGKGIGTALLRAVEEEARKINCRKIWLITSNDNLDALRFYQIRGYRLTAVYPGAIDEARKLKPGIPEIGFYQIPLHDEIELSKEL